MEAPAWELPWGWTTIVVGLIGWSVAEVVFALLSVAATLLLLFGGQTDGQAGNPVQSTAITVFFQVWPLITACYSVPR